VLANGSQYGNGARVSPDARLDDGLLDLVVIASHSPWRNVLRSRHLFDGTLARRAGVLSTRVERVVIEDRAGPVWFHADGETLEHHGPLEACVHRAALHVIAPGLA
jgi:diacylglycerol kinase (ATP)